MTTYYTANKVPPEERTNRIGDAATRGGVITVDTPVTDVSGAKEFFKSLFIKTGGDLLVKGMDDAIIPYLGVPSGTLIKVIGYEVVSSATIGGTGYTTSASGITWQGGI